VIKKCLKWIITQPPKDPTTVSEYSHIDFLIKNAVERAKLFKKLESVVLIGVMTKRRYY
jgi:hypothetical protein